VGAGEADEAPLVLDVPEEDESRFFLPREGTSVPERFLVHHNETTAERENTKI